MTRTFELNVALCFHGKPLSCLLVAAGTLEASLLPCIGLHVGEIGAGDQDFAGADHSLLCYSVHSPRESFYHIG